MTKPQLNYIHSINLGFDQERIVIIPNAWQILNRDPAFIARDAITELPGVVGVTSGSDLGALADVGWYHRVRAQQSDTPIDIIGMEIDHRFFDVYGMALKEGQTFSANTLLRSVEDVKVVLNETAVGQLGLKEPVVGQKVVFVRDEGNFEIPVIGVVGDFHFNSLHTEIKPIYFAWNNEALKYAVKLAAGDIRETLEQIEAIWSEYAPNAPFEYYFLDSTIERQYRFERNFRTTLSAMTGLSLLVACLGLLGLVAFAVEQRAKEIGIRKVLGASIQNVVTLFSTDFIKLIALANLCACPFAYFAMNRWLADFSYRVDIGGWTFVFAATAALILAVFTVGFQTIKAAVANPIEALRSE